MVLRKDGVGVFFFKALSIASDENIMAIEHCDISPRVEFE